MPSKKEILQKIYDLTYKYEAERGSCPQCVFSAIMEVLKIGNPETIKAADGLAGGTALSTQGTCGALVGGIMAISTVVGRSYEDFSANNYRRRVFQYSKKLYDKFQKEYGSVVCKDIHKRLFGRTFDLMDKDDYNDFEKMGAHIDKCTSISGNVARWTAEIILDILQK